MSARTQCPQCSQARRKSRDKCLWTSPDNQLRVCFHCGYTSSDRQAETYAQRTERMAEQERAKLKRWAGNRPKVAALWASGRPVQVGDAVDRYLRGRMIALDAYPAAIRFAPRCRYFDDDGRAAGDHSAMLCAVRDRGGNLVAVHRVYLTEDGRKAAVPTVKKLSMTCGDLAGAAIRLAPVSSAGVLGVAEGLETAAACMVGSGGVPTWSSISASGMAAFVAPASVRRLIVLADNDENQTGQRAAAECAGRARRSGIDGRVLVPPKVGFDWNDILIERLNEVRT